MPSLGFSWFVAWIGIFTSFISRSSEWYACGSGGGGGGVVSSKDFVECVLASSVVSEEQERTLQEQGWLKCFKSLSFSVVSGKRESVLKEQGKLKHFKNLSSVKKN